MMAADMMNPPPNGSGSGSMSRKEVFEAQLRDLQQDISVLSVKLRPTAAAALEVFAHLMALHQEVVALQNLL